METADQKLQDSAQAVLRGAFSQQMSTLRKTILIIKLNLYQKEQNKRKKKKETIKYKKEKKKKNPHKEKIKAKASRYKDIRKNRVENK